MITGCFIIQVISLTVHKLFTQSAVRRVTFALRHWDYSKGLGWKGVTLARCPVCLRRAGTVITWIRGTLGCM